MLDSVKTVPSLHLGEEIDPKFRHTVFVSIRPLSRLTSLGEWYKFNVNWLCQRARPQNEAAMPV